MLARACFCDDPSLPEPLRQEDLPDRIIDLVRPSMAKVLALQEYLRIVFPAQAPGEI